MMRTRLGMEERERRTWINAKFIIKCLMQKPVEKHVCLRRRERKKREKREKKEKKEKEREKRKKELFHVVPVFDDSIREWPFEG